MLDFRVRRFAFLIFVVAGDRMKTSKDITALLNQVNSGDPTAIAELIPILYKDLRRLAAH